MVVLIIILISNYILRMIMLPIMYELCIYINFKFIDYVTNIYN